MDQKRLRPLLKSVHLWGLAVGLVVSGDYFGWNFGFAKANVWEFGIAILLVACFYLLFALCFTELAASIPQSAGPAAYAKRASGPIFGFFTGFFVLVEFLLAPPAIALALGGYLHFLFPVLPTMGTAIVVFGFLVVLNLTGIEQTSRFELLVTVIAVSGLCLYLVLLAFSSGVPQLPNWEMAPPISYVSILETVPFAIWFFLAVEGVALTAEEVRSPAKDIPIGYVAGILTLLLLAFSIFLFTAMYIDPKEIAYLDYPLSFVLHKYYGKESIWPLLFTFIGLFGLVASLFGILLGNSRLLYAMSRERYLPSFLGKLSAKTSIPQNAVFVSGAFGFLCLLCFDVTELITASALGASFLYIFSLISFLLIRKKERDLHRPFVAPGYPWLPLLALCLGFGACFAIILTNLLVAGFVLGFGFISGFIYYLYWKASSS